MAKTTSMLAAVLAAAVLATLVLVVVILQRTQRELTTLRASVTRIESGPATAAATGDLPANRFPTGMNTRAPFAPPGTLPSHPEREPVSPPQSPEAKAFVDSHHLSPAQWETVVRSNRSWVQTLERVKQHGETAAGGPLPKLASDRDKQIETAIGKDGVRDYHALESKSGEGRIRLTTPGDQHTWEGVKIE